MKDRIIQYLKQEDYKGMDIHELAGVFKQHTTEQFKSFVKMMVTLEEQKIVIRTKNDNYYLSQSKILLTGKVMMSTKGFAFIHIGDDEADIYVANQNLNGALHGDIVQVELENQSTGNSKEGKIVNIIERGQKQLVGLVVKRKGKYLLLVDDPKFNEVVIIVGNRKGAIEGHKVVVKITDYHQPLNAKIIKVLGHKNDPGVDIMSIVSRYEIPVEFNEDIFEQLSTIEDEINTSDFQNRIDLRHDTIFTIDGDDAKDLDDAISIKKVENGNYQLGVHIADVSNYVLEGTPIDKEAIQRGTSVYLVDRVIPMLPHQLSNGICSLNPNVDRLTISCIMEIDQNGQVVDYQIIPTIIHSNYRMTYHDVNMILDGNIKLQKKYQKIVSKLFMMEKLAIILNQNRNKRGAIHFHTNESKVMVDKKGKPIEIKLRHRGMSEKMIEEFMLVANETVAKHFKWLELPFVYRIHEHPKKKKLLNFVRIVSPLGYKIKGSLDHVYPKELSQLLDKAKDKPEYNIISTLLLRCMQKAKYDVECLGHYGLADEYYTHFTSPIRRYPDLLVHRLIKTYLFQQDISKETTMHYSEILPALTEKSSTREIIATNCERDVLDMKKAEYMARHIGDEYEGIISSVTSFGFFVELPNTVEGLVHISTLKDDYYVYNEQYMMIVGESTGKKYRISDKVKVVVVNTSKVEGSVDFEIVLSNSKKKKYHNVSKLKKEKSNKQISKRKNRNKRGYHENYRTKQKSLS